jgi:hypothetical protein
MKIWKITAITFIFAFVSVTAVCAQEASPAIDFFMHGGFHDTFLRDHYRFEEPKPLRIEYWYTRWLDSSGGDEEYRDNIYIEALLPVYSGRNLIVDIPFQYIRVPIWAESEQNIFARTTSFVRPHLTTRWRITDQLKSIVGWEYNLKGDSENIGKPAGRKICLLKGFFSYDLHDQLNLVAGVRFDRYYYDTDEETDTLDTFKLADRLYYKPAVMLNWHPSDDFSVLLGIPGAGFHLALGKALKVEARASIDKEVEIALRVKPVERTSMTLRFINTPYTEIPIRGRTFDGILAERLYHTEKAVLFDIGRELNPAALASLGFRYSPSRDVTLKDRFYKDSVELDGKSYFSVGATFIVDLEALVKKR